MEQVLKVIYTVLSAASSVTDITTRLYPIVAPEQTDFPCVVYTITGVRPYPTKSGAASIDDMFVTVDCYAQDTEAASGHVVVSTLSEAVRDSLDRKTPGTYATVSIDGVDFVDGSTGFDKQSDVFVSTLDFKFRVKR